MSLRELSARSNALFVIVSFEGPDLWSQAGGLGIRVTELTNVLAELGHEVHLFFMGDPSLPGEEIAGRGRIRLHRWAQWISRHARSGVYDAEEHKRSDLSASLPPYLIERVLLPAIRAGRVPIILSEEWQTAECATSIADRLCALGIRDRAILAWNANNAYSFDRIDWQRLAATNTITTVSRYMRSIVRARGVDALVVPNGIPQRLVAPINRWEVRQLRRAFAGTPFFFKMARWQHDKGWIQALDAIRLLRERGRRTLLVARSGGPGGVGGILDAEAAARGLTVFSVHAACELEASVRHAVAGGGDVLSLRFGVNESLARILFAAADAVLANSVSEPFGLVGLEAMAAGGLIYTGGTGEDYAVSGQNAVVLETLEPSEIADRADELAATPQRIARIRRAARHTARDYTWPHTSKRLFRLIEAQARKQRLRVQLMPVDTPVLVDAASPPELVPVARIDAVPESFPLAAIAAT